jgi:hypothetical protein
MMDEVLAGLDDKTRGRLLDALLRTKDNLRAAITARQSTEHQTVKVEAS